MKRTSGIAPSQPKPAKGPKLKKCAVRTCRKPFEQRSISHKACGPECAQIVAAQIAAAKRVKEEKAQRATDNAKREAMKTIPDLLAEVRTFFNAWVNLRDADKPCISCGSTRVATGLKGGKRDCGHYRSVGSAGHLRFNEDNAHSQCKYCNEHLSGSHVMYRQGLKERIGLERLEAVESNNEVHKWTHSELRDLKARYQRLIKEMRKGEA
jgi:hypothetical protein